MAQLTSAAAGAAAAAARGASTRLGLGSLTYSPHPHSIALASVALLLAGGAALLATFMVLGRPPISLPTLAGLRLFLPLVLVLLVTWEREAQMMARLWGRSITAARAWVLAGYAPLGVAWLLVGVLYHAEAHHWFVTVESVKPAMAVTVVAPTTALKLALLAAAIRGQLIAWSWHYRYVLTGATYAMASLAAKPSLWHIDLPGWFVPAAKLILAGRPLEMYGIRADVMGTPAPVEHGPLTILFYAPFVAVAEAFGSVDFFQIGALFPLAGVVVVDCVMAYQAAQATRDLAPDISEQQLFGLSTLILFSPLLWFSSVWLVHLESLLTLLLITSVRLLSRRRVLAAGAALGAALLVKHSAALAVGPLLLILALTGPRGLAVRAGAVAAAVVAGGLLPFAVAAPSDFWFNFVGYEALKPIYGLTIWKALYDSGLEPLVMQLDSLVIGLLAVLSTIALALASHRRGAGKAAGQAALPDSGKMAEHSAGASLVSVELCWIAIVLGQITWLGLATWQYPHYFVVCFVALLIWESAVVARRRDGGWPILSLLFLFVPFNLQTHVPRNVGKAGGAFVVARAAAQFIFLYGCALAVWLRSISSGPPHPRHEPAGNPHRERLKVMDGADARG